MSYKILNAEKIKESLKKSLSVIRTGRVNSSVLDHVMVKAYGSNMGVKEVATITIPERSQLLITPFDKGLNSAIEKGIIDANIGANPMNDGAGIRLSFPPLTEETRKLRSKEVSKMLEDIKVAIRSNRQDFLKSMKHKKDESEISEDELKRYETDLQKEVDNLNKEVEEMAKSKQDELMKI